MMGRIEPIFKKGDYKGGKKSAIFHLYMLVVLTYQVF